MKIARNIWLLLGIIITMMSITACEEDEDTTGSKTITVTGIYLEDTESTVPDRLVTFARKGQLLRVEGSGMTGMRKIYINGYETYFNPVFVSETSMLVQVSNDTPITEAKTTERNTIRFVKTGTELTHPFAIRDAAPSITKISHTLPLAGEEITIYGSGLTEVSKITFPGNKVVTEGITSDEEGEFVKVKMPEGVTEGGSILIECSNGGAYSPAYFNCKACVILDFDGLGKQGFWGWKETGSMMNQDDLESEVRGEGNVSQGKYCAHRPKRMTSIAAGKNRATEVWTAGNGEDKWREQLTPIIPATTPVDKVAFQFDIYIPNAWSNTGFLKICLFNSFNGGEWSNQCFNFVPWILDGKAVPVTTTGWTTVTIPFSKFYAYSGTTESYTFENVLADREKSSYCNFGIYFENSDITLSKVTGKTTDTAVLASSETTINVYTDNWRVVSLATPTFGDFPENSAE